MTEELIATISKLGGLGVIARTSILRYKGLTKPVAEIGKELSVASVLEGSVRIAGRKIRITAQLIDTTTEEHVWSEVYDRELEDVFAIQSDIARRIAQALKIKILKDEGSRLEEKATESPDAYKLYLKGRHLLNARTEESLQKAVETFEEALEKDPDYEQAYTGLSDAHAVLALLEFVPPKQAFPRAKAAAEKALEIDKDLSEAHTSLGVVKFQYDWDFVGAEKEFRKAIELSPNLAPAHQFYADCLKASGRFDGALAQMKQASQLDPLSLAINTGIGHVLYLSRNYDRAIEQYRKTVTLDPNFVQARLWFGRPFLQKGTLQRGYRRTHRSGQAVERQHRLAGNSRTGIRSCRRQETSAPDSESIEGTVKATVCSVILDSPLYVALRDKRQAFEWLDRAFEERSSWLAWIKVEPRFDPIRDDSRFATLLQRMGLQGKEVKLSAKEMGISAWLKGPK
jgi:adenylate cyclase